MYSLEMTYEYQLINTPSFYGLAGSSLAGSVVKQEWYLRLLEKNQLFTITVNTFSQGKKSSLFSLPLVLFLSCFMLSTSCMTSVYIIVLQCCVSNSTTYVAE